MWHVIIIHHKNILHNLLWIAASQGCCSDFWNKAVWVSCYSLSPTVVWISAYWSWIRPRSAEFAGEAVTVRTLLHVAPCTLTCEWNWATLKRNRCFYRSHLYDSRTIQGLSANTANKQTDQVKTDSKSCICEVNGGCWRFDGFAMVIRASETHSDLTAGILDEKQPELPKIFKQMDRLWGPESRGRELMFWLRPWLALTAATTFLLRLQDSQPARIHRWTAAQSIAKKLKPKPNLSSFVSSAWDAVLECAQTLADSPESVWKPWRPLDDGRFDQNKHGFCNRLPVFPVFPPPDWKPPLQLDWSS